MHHLTTCAMALQHGVTMAQEDQDRWTSIVWMVRTRFTTKKGVDYVLLSKLIYSTQVSKEILPCLIPKSFLCILNICCAIGPGEQIRYSIQHRLFNIV